MAYVSWKTSQPALYNNSVAGSLAEEVSAALGKHTDSCRAEQPARLLFKPRLAVGHLAVRQQTKNYGKRVQMEASVCPDTLLALAAWGDVCHLEACHNGESAIAAPHGLRHALSAAFFGCCMVCAYGDIL